MVVSILPFDIAEGCPEKNIETVAEYIRHVREDASILVLPELFSTGFIKEEDRLYTLAETINGNTIQELKSLAKTHNIAISGSYLARENTCNSIFNRAFFINPDEDCKVYTYDKRHLFTISPEHKLLTSSNLPSPIISYRGWNIAMSICFDIRFPAWCRNFNNAYDMMLIPANWPDSRYHAWKHLLIARAIENVAAFVGCNRAGIDIFGTYSYLSSFGVDHRGTIVSEIHGNTPLRHATFSIEALREFREKFPVWKSADSFNIEA